MESGLTSVAFIEDFHECIIRIKTPLPWHTLSKRTVSNMEKDRNMPELATFTLLNPDFHARVDQTAYGMSDKAKGNDNKKRPKR